jgi:hypothetical protein
MEQTDSLKLEEHEDGGMTISWDANDPKYSWMNDLTEEEVQSIIRRALAEAIQDE